MTNAQKLWLDANPQFEICGRLGGMARYVDKGTLMPDGKFKLGLKPKPTEAANGAFEVAMRTVFDPNNPGRPADPRGNPNERGYDHQGGGEKI